MAQTIDLLKNSSFETQMELLTRAILKEKNYLYSELIDKPQINGYTLEENKTASQLGLLADTDIETVNIDFSTFF